MTILIQYANFASDKQIIAQLHKLREHSLVNNSHFAVAAVVEIKLKDSYGYVGGVNVELPTANRLSIHAEQNAIATTMALFGGGTKFSKVWVMGALDNIKENNSDVSANSLIYPCGHCRQILQSLAVEDAKVYCVTVNGAITASHKLQDLLPHAFTESDYISSEIKTQHNMNESNGGFTFFTIPKPRPWNLINESSNLSEQDIWEYFRSMSPHIIKPEHQTSNITACIIKFANPLHYSSGVLVQDAAFLTTDAIFAAIGQAISQFGASKLSLQEIHLYGNSFKTLSLNGNEIEMIKQFLKKDIPIYFYTSREKKVGQCNFSSCIIQHHINLLKELHVVDVKSSITTKVPVLSKL